MFKNAKQLGFVALMLIPSLVRGDTNANTDQQATSLPGEQLRAEQGTYAKSAAYLCDNNVGLFFSGDYVYWNWVQTRTLTLEEPQTTLGLPFSGSVGSPQPLLNPGYASGFSVGMGYNMKNVDNWSLFAEYTWYRNSANGSATMPAGAGIPGSVGSLEATGKANIHYDNLDFVVERSYYIGKRLTATFLTGLKGLWISNKTTTSGYGSATNSSGLLFEEVNITNYNIDSKVNSWSIGPKFGFESVWLLGAGFKFLADLDVSILYSKFSGTKTETDIGSVVTLVGGTVSVDSYVSTPVDKVSPVNPMLESFIGLGWGSYLVNNSFHVDMSAGYNFNIIRVTNGNLSLHGLNIKLQFNF